MAGPSNASRMRLDDDGTTMSWVRFAEGNETQVWDMYLNNPYPLELLPALVERLWPAVAEWLPDNFDDYSR